LLFWLAVTVPPAIAGAVTVEEGPDGVTLANRSLAVTVSREGVLSAARVSGRRRTPVLSGAVAAIRLRGRDADILEGVKPTLSVRDARGTLAPGKAVVVAYEMPAARVRVIYTLPDKRECFTTRLVLAPATETPIAARSVTVLKGELALGDGQIRVLAHPRARESKVAVLEGDEVPSGMMAALYNRETRLGTVLGALSQHAESHVRCRLKNRVPHVEMTADYAGPGAGELHVAPGETAGTGAYAVFFPKEIFEGLEAYGALVKEFNGIRLHRPIPCGWCSWDAFGWIMRGEQIDRTIETIYRNRLPAYGFNVLQIDDGWQCGWRCSGDWRPNPRRFPGGIKPIAEACKAAGFRLGLWIAPFSDEDRNASAGPDGGLKPDAPEWMREARPVLVNRPELMVKRNGELTGSYDLSHPEFKTLLTDTLRRLTHEWGARYIKADFLGYGAGFEADPSLPAHDIYRNALRAMRDGMAEGTYFVTSGECDWKSLGIADGQRIGGDVSATWEGIYPTARVAAPRYFANGRLWWNDPDQLHVGGRLGTDGVQRGLTLNQARAWAAMVVLHGGVTMTGDRLEDLSPDRMKLLTQCMPPTGVTARPIDLWDVLTEAGRERYSRLWALALRKRFGTYHVVGVFNWTAGHRQAVDLDLRRLGYPSGKRLLVYDYWDGHLVTVGRARETVPLQVAPSSCRLLVVHPTGSRPQFVSSDRHLTAGGVDVERASYLSLAGLIKGQSVALVGGVPFRYTFYVPDGVRVAEAVFDGAPGKVVPTPREPNLVVIEFTPTQGEIDWRVEFKKEAKAK